MPCIASRQKSQVNTIHMALWIRTSTQAQSRWVVISMIVDPSITSRQPSPQVLRYWNHLLSKEEHRLITLPCQTIIQGWRVGRIRVGLTWGDLLKTWAAMTNSMKHPQVALLRKLGRKTGCRRDCSALRKELGKARYSQAQWSKCLLMGVKITTWWMCMVLEVGCRTAPVQDISAEIQGQVIQRVTLSKDRILNIKETLQGLKDWEIWMMYRWTLISPNSRWTETIVGRKGTLQSLRIRRIFWSLQKKRSQWNKVATYWGSNNKIRLQEIRELWAEIPAAFSTAWIECTNKCQLTGLSTV